MSLPSCLRSFAFSDSMCPPLPVTIRATLGRAIPSTSASTRTPFLVPNSLADPGTSTHAHLSPLMSIPIGAVKVKSSGVGIGAASSFMRIHYHTARAKHYAYCRVVRPCRTGRWFVAGREYALNEVHGVRHSAARYERRNLLFAVYSTPLKQWAVGLRPVPLPLLF